MAFESLRRLFSPNEGNEDLATPEHEVAVFLLTYEENPVGFLRFMSGKWRFEYCKQFKEQNRLKPLESFPDMERVYESSKLWPFFAMRIPSLKQPVVQRRIKELTEETRGTADPFDPTNEIDLLKAFGEKAIANRFSLTPVLLHLFKGHLFRVNLYKPPQSLSKVHIEPEALILFGIFILSCL